MANNYFRVRGVEFFFDDGNSINTASSRRIAEEYADCINEIEKKTLGPDVEPPDVVVWKHAAPVGLGPREMTCIGGCEFCAARPLNAVERETD